MLALLLVALVSATGEQLAADQPDWANDREFLEFLPHFLARYEARQKEAGRSAGSASANYAQQQSPADLRESLEELRKMHPGDTPGSSDSFNAAVAGAPVSMEQQLLQRFGSTVMRKPDAAMLADELAFAHSRRQTAVAQRVGERAHLLKAQAEKYADLARKGVPGARKMHEMLLKKSQEMFGLLGKRQPYVVATKVQGAKAMADMKSKEKMVQKLAQSFDEALKQVDDLEFAMRRGVPGADDALKAAQKNLEHIMETGAAMKPSDVIAKVDPDFKPSKLSQMKDRLLARMEKASGAVLDRAIMFRNEAEKSKFIKDATRMAQKLKKPYDKAYQVARYVPEKIWGAAQEVKQVGATGVKQVGNGYRRIKDAAYMLAPQLAHKVEMAALNARCPKRGSYFAKSGPHLRGRRIHGSSEKHARGRQGNQRRAHVCSQSCPQTSHGCVCNRVFHPYRCRGSQGLAHAAKERNRGQATGPTADQKCHLCCHWRRFAFGTRANGKDWLSTRVGRQGYSAPSCHVR